VRSYHPRSLDAPPEASVVVYIIPPTNDDAQLLDSYLTAAQYLGPLLPDPPEGTGHARKGGAPPGAADLATAAGVGADQHNHHHNLLVAEQSSQVHGGAGGGGGGGGSTLFSPPHAADGGHATPASALAPASTDPTPARALPPAPDAVSPAVVTGAFAQQQQQQQQHHAAAGGEGEGGAGRTGGRVQYTATTGSVHSAASLSLQGAGRRVDVVLQCVRRGAVECAGEAELRALALSVYTRVGAAFRVQHHNPSPPPGFDMWGRACDLGVGPGMWCGAI